MKNSCCASRKIDIQDMKSELLFGGISENGRNYYLYCPICKASKLMPVKYKRNFEYQKTSMNLSDYLIMLNTKYTKGCDFTLITKEYDILMNLPNSLKGFLENKTFVANYLSLIATLYGKYYFKMYSMYQFSYVRLGLQEYLANNSSTYEEKLYRFTDDFSMKELDDVFNQVESYVKKAAESAEDFDALTLCSVALKSNIYLAEIKENHFKYGPLIALCDEKYRVTLNEIKEHVYGKCVSRSFEDKKAEYEKVIKERKKDYFDEVERALGITNRVLKIKFRKLETVLDLERFLESEATLNNITEYVRRRVYDILFNSENDSCISPFLMDMPLSEGNYEEISAAVLSEYLRIKEELLYIRIYKKAVK